MQKSIQSKYRKKTLLAIFPLWKMSLHGSKWDQSESLNVLLLNE